MLSKILHYTLLVLRRIYFIISNNNEEHRNRKMFSNKEYANDLIYKQLMNKEPCMIARFGSTEMNCIVNYLGVKNKNKNYLGFIKGDILEWWWKKSFIVQMKSNAGFFPSHVDKIEQFCKLMIEDAKEVDILGSWLIKEKYIKNEIKNAKQLVLEDLEPFFTTNPWTKALEGKKVLVIHPFSESIEDQYKKRELLFENNLLPQFELKTIKAVQSLQGEKVKFIDWFEALDSMKNQMDQTNYDICIVGAGAYGFPLTAHAKRSGKKAIHLAGVTQLLFGIKGKRWENFLFWPYMNLFNEHWVRPSVKENPKNANQVEGSCYW
jgi:hypothetical protein